MLRVANGLDNAALDPPHRLWIRPLQYKFYISVTKVLDVYVDKGAKALT